MFFDNRTGVHERNSQPTFIPTPQTRGIGNVNKYFQAASPLQSFPPKHDIIVFLDRIWKGVVKSSTKKLFTWPLDEFSLHYLARVIILEAQDNLAGRALCQTMSDGTEAAMGMMRFGRGQAIWGELLTAFGYELKDDFPDPGVVPTLIAFDNERLNWNDANVPPEGYGMVSEGFKNFVQNGWNGLKSWHEIRQRLQDGNNVIPYVQQWIDQFKGKTIGEGIRMIFANQWSEREFRFFDTFGVGSGGYGVFNHLSFLVLMRMIVNGLEDKQRGISKRRSDGSYRSASPQEVVQRLGTCAKVYGVEIKLGKVVTRVERFGQKIKVFVNGHNTPYVADHAILGTPFPAVRRIRGLSQFIDPDILNTMAQAAGGRAGKMFALVDVSEIPGVNSSTFPKMLLSNKATEQVYVMRAKDPNKRLVLLWYAWEGAYAAMANKSQSEILDICKGAIRSIVRGHAHEGTWNMMLRKIVETKLIKWPSEQFFGAAFNNPFPNSVEKYNDIMFWWKTLERRSGLKIFIDIADAAGLGGWNEGGLGIALMNASSIIKKHGVLFKPNDAPCNTARPDTFNY